MESMENSFDSEMIRRCLTLAKQAAGQTSPNPLVGSVIVKDTQIVGEGFHHKAGQAHAEVNAIHAARDQTVGATLYVNLEPCAHYGRTPPCSEAILKAGISKVVVGMIDPDPRVAGRGIAQLQAAGLEVLVGIEEAASRRLNEAFIHRTIHRQPFGIYKYAMTLDGKIATTTGDSAWVTRPTSRHFVHQLRSTCDAVIVGGNTVRLDNPHLTTHQLTPHNPTRIVLSHSLNLPLNAHLWRQEEAKTVIFTQKDSNQVSLLHLADLGVEIKQLDQLTPQAVMTALYEQGMAKVLWECGGKLAAAALKDGSVQKVLAFIAPKIIGGQQAPSPVDDLGLVWMRQALELHNVSLTQLEGDFLVEGYVNKQ